MNDRFWLAVAVDTQEKSCAASAEDTELKAIEKAKADFPGRKIFAVVIIDDMTTGQLIDQCISRMADIDIIGGEATTIAESVADMLYETVEDEKESSSECLWFAGMVLSSRDASSLTKVEQDRLAVHATSCERCGAFVDNIAEAMQEEDFGISPAKIRESQRLAQETLERLAKKGQS